ncbi:MAG: hypothetical protein U0166_29150 [Acidobacteriota bacterium]
MSPQGHVLTSAVAGAAVAAASGNPLAGAACLLAGIFIDLDHFLEYFWFEGLKIDIADFKRACEETRFPKVLLVLHSWELLAAGWTVALAAGPSGARTIGLAALVGLSLHLVLDQIYNEPFPLCYFLCYRLGVGLDAARIFKPVMRRRTAMEGARVR